MDSIEDDEVSPPRTAAQAGEQRARQPGAVPALRQRRQGQLVLAQAAHLPRGHGVSSSTDESAGLHAPRKPGAVPAQRRRQPGPPSLACAVPHAQRKLQHSSSCDTSAEDVSTSGSDSNGQGGVLMSRPADRNSPQQVASAVLACHENLVRGSSAEWAVLGTQAVDADDTGGSRLVLDLRPETLKLLQPSVLFKCAYGFGSRLLGLQTLLRAT